MDRALLAETLADAGEPSYRASQVWEWVARGADGYEEMTNLPAALREQLVAAVPLSTLAVEAEARSDDGTVKTLFHTADGRPLEAVLMRYRDGRRSVCVSSQSGCPLTCTFCATGTMKFGRNLTTDEILDQALHFRRVEDDRPRRLHGDGRADDEHRQRARRLRAAARRSASPTAAPRSRPSAGCRGSTASPNTSGRSRWRSRCTRRTTSCARSSCRSTTATRWREVLAACERYMADRRRQVFVEYVMLDGVNDHPEHARELAALLDRHKYKVNLIPYNPTGAYDGSSPERIERFRAILAEHRLTATVRLTRGREIAAACGQLAVAAA